MHPLADTGFPEFMPHGHCYYWEPYILWSHAIADGLIALAYFAIPLSLTYIFRKRRDITFVWMMVLFSIFILGCGITHIFDVITIWNPIYRADSVVRIITAAASIGTAIVLLRITPRILSIPSSQQWVDVNKRLQESNQELTATNEELIATIEELRLTNDKLQQANAELDRANSQLNQANRDLDRSNQELERFAYVASHDLQEPLRKVKAFSGLLAKDYAPVVQGNGVMYMERMESAVSRMQHLIDDLLSYSRISRQENVFTEVNLNEVAARVLDELELKIQKTQADITVGELPALPGIASQLSQVFANLLNNALKFTKPDVSPKILVDAQTATADDIATHEHNPDFRYTCIRFADNGIGFDPEYAEKIFGIFERLHGKLEYEGSGIGLSICRRIVENHKGKIWAASQPGQGAVFTLMLPLGIKNDD